MLATMERVLILENAEQISQMITRSEIADYYISCLNNVKNNKETQRKIQEFVKMKEQFENVQRFGKYHPDYKKVSKETRALKRAMDLDENIAKFRQAEADLQCLLDEISALIGRAVSEQIKVPTGNPFFDTAGCSSGGCGTGGSCGCSS